VVGLIPSTRAGSRIPLPLIAMSLRKLLHVRSVGSISVISNKRIPFTRGILAAIALFACGRFAMLNYIDFVTLGTMNWL
jgi:hypothetical protein